MLFAILAPAAAGLVAFAVPSNRRRPLVLLAGAALHLGALVALLAAPPPARPGAWLAFDAISKVLLLTTSVLFAAVFVMGIVMFHINREFSSLDTEKLSALKD